LVPRAPSIRKLALAGATAIVKLSKPAGGGGLQCALVRVPSGKHAVTAKPVWAHCGASVTYRHLRKGSGYLFFARTGGQGGVDSAAVKRSFKAH
jgi:hypothetical protein